MDLCQGLPILLRGNKYSLLVPAAAAGAFRRSNHTVLVPEI